MTAEDLDGCAETLELINAEVAARLDRQAASRTQIDAKALALAGYALAAAAFLATQHPEPVLAVLAYVAYTAALTLAVASFAAGAFDDVPDPRALFEHYMTQPRPAVLAALAATRVEAFEANARRHARKARFWWLSLGCLAAGAVLMVASILVHTGGHDIAASARASRQPAEVRAGG